MEDSCQLKDQFDRDGFVVVPGFITIGEADSLREELVVLQADGRLLLRKQAAMNTTLGVGEQSERIRGLFGSERLLTMVERILQLGPTRFWHDQLLAKPVRSTVTPWHQDQPFWPFRNTPALTCWIALDRMTVENGCLRFLRGSHVLPEMSLTEVGALTDHAVNEIAKQRGTEITCLEMQPGDCSFHHPLVLHGAGCNASSRQRYAVKAIYVSGNTLARPREHIRGAAVGVQGSGIPS